MQIALIDFIGNISIISYLEVEKCENSIPFSTSELRNSRLENADYCNILLCSRIVFRTSYNVKVMTQINPG